MRKTMISSACFLFLASSSALATPDATQLAVWANEAIVATYTFSHADFLERQREIAHYFSAEGWTKYLTALNASGLPDAVKKNAYDVSAVALLPPEVTISGNGTQWQASMPLLVVYKNPQYQQKQTLQIKITFTESPNASQGVRGLMLNSLQSTSTSDPCECKPVTAVKQNDGQSSTNAGQSGTGKAQ